MLKQEQARIETGAGFKHKAKVTNINTFDNRGKTCCSKTMCNN